MHLNVSLVSGKLYRFLADSFKVADRFCGYRLGSMIRKQTNPNTENYWNKRFENIHTWRDFPYRHLIEFLPKGEAFSLLDIGCALGDGFLLIKENSCF